MVSVTYINREFRKTNYSIEGIFDSVKCELKDKIEIRNYYADAGLSRLKNIFKVRAFAGEINHITGDINFLALGISRRKNVLTIHDFGFYENPVHSKMTRLLYKLFWFSLPLRCVDLVTVVSGFTKEKLIKYFFYPEEKIRVIPNPVKTIFKKAARTGGKIRPVILQIGSGAHKNLINLVEAVKGVDCHIEIIGWPGENEIRQLQQYNVSYSVNNSLSEEEVYQKYKDCDILFFCVFL